MRGVMPILKCEIYQVNTQNWSVETVVKWQYLNYKKWKTEEKERLIKWDKWDSSMSLWVGILVTTTWLFRAIFTIFLLLLQCCLLHSSSGIGKPSWHLKEENINRWVCCLSVCLPIRTWVKVSIVDWQSSIFSQREGYGWSLWSSNHFIRGSARSGVSLYLGVSYDTLGYWLTGW